MRVIRVSTSFASALIALAFVLAAPCVAEAVDAYEPDDATATAPAIGTDRTWMYRAIEPAGDVDRIAIPARAGRYYELTIKTEHTVSSPLLDVVAFDVDGGVLAQVQVPGHAELWHTVRASGDGTITLLISGGGGDTGWDSGGYSVKAFEYVGAALSGTVTNRQGDRVPGAVVALHGERERRQVYTDGTGGYSFAALPPGSYRVHFEAAGYAAQSYPLAPDHDEEYRMGISLLGHAVLLADGDDRRGIDASLSRPAVLSGRVLDPSGGGAYHVGIGVYWLDPHGEWRLFAPFTTWSGPDGTYRYGVPEGTYAVAFRDWAGRWPDVFYSNATSAAPTPVVADEGEQVVGLDQVTPALATLTGRVADRRRRPVHGIRVKVFGRVLMPDGTGDRWVDEHVATVTPDRRGLFSVGGLGSGTYRLLVTDPRGRYPDQWYLRERGDAYSKSLELVAGRTTHVSIVPASSGPAIASAAVLTRAGSSPTSRDDLLVAPRYRR